MASAMIYDEVKTGVTIAAGGATERFGVQPDLACLAKAVAGGLPGAAFGGRADFMRLDRAGVSQMGTYNGNPWCPTWAGDAEGDSHAGGIHLPRSAWYAAGDGVPK